jgi:sulfur relay (sulfurtransferase) DsrF/TusC family protein
MSTLLNKDSISLSITKQLNIQNQVVISALSGIIDNAQMVDYDSIKLLSKAIKEHLKSNNIEAQHSKVLNIIAKALGYQNHHSLKNNFIPEQTTVINIDFLNDSTLKKFFAIKDEFLNQFDIDKLQIVHGVHKGHEFDFLYHKQGIGLKRKDKIEVNKFLRAHNIKPYKNTITLFKIKYDNIYKVAFNILQHYQSFFKPIWCEKDNTLNNYEHMINFGIQCLILISIKPMVF